jgi:hypothetical protein
MSEPIWIEVASSHEAVELVETLARHGIRGASVATTGDAVYVRIPASRERTPELLLDVYLALSRSDAGTSANSLAAAPTHADDEPAEDDDERQSGLHVPLSSALGRELKRIAQNPIREVERLEREAQAGQNPATPAILIAGMAVSLWTFVALVVAAALLVAHLVV